MEHYSLYFAQAYGEGSYGEGNYSCTTEQQQAGACVAASGSSNGGSGGTLTDTGIGIVAVASLACLIIFVALVIRIWRRPKVAEATVAPATDADSPERLAK